MNLAGSLIIDVWETHPEVTGILSTVISKAVDPWRPGRPVQKKLRQLCEGAVASDNWAAARSVEPLAFALGAKGDQAVHRKLLERLILDPKWRDAHAGQIGLYYGTVGVEVAAIRRHWLDPFRKGILRVHDITLLMSLLYSADRMVSSAGARSELLSLLEKNAGVLKSCGENELARPVSDLVEALRRVGATKAP